MLKDELWTWIEYDVKYLGSQAHRKLSVAEDGIEVADFMVTLYNKELKTDELLDEDQIGEFFRWCPTDDMKADLLTKKSAKAERLAWFRELHMVRIRTKKPKKEKSPYAPNRPKPTLPMSTLRELTAEALGLL